VAKPITNPAAYLKKHLTRRSRVLLVNPPVQERRYHWIRWNQPLDLLRLSTWLKTAHAGIEVRLFDFMQPNEAGQVPKHKVKETWTGAHNNAQLWHFGQSFDAFEKAFTSLSQSGWRPDFIVVTSLTSYWHVSIEKLLNKLCSRLDRTRRDATTICIVGNYPLFEPMHAACQLDADVVFTSPMDTSGCQPDFQIYLDSGGDLPNFFALDINDGAISDHLAYCLALTDEKQRRRGIPRPASFTVAFFNDDVCSPSSQLERVVAFAGSHPGRLIVEGIVGIEPRSLTKQRLQQLKAAGFRSLFVEHARQPGGGVDPSSYEPLLTFLSDEAHQKKVGDSKSAWLDRGNVTGFVAMGLPDDDVDELVRSTLTINKYFQAVILKPFGYSPTIERISEAKRRKRWREPYMSSAQWFPYVGNGSSLSDADYDNLVRWQNVLNKRVKGSTFDFLDGGVVAQLVRETLIAESWKRHREAR
jgi:hypothetical protein